MSKFERIDKFEANSPIERHGVENVSIVPSHEIPAIKNELPKESVKLQTPYEAAIEKSSRKNSQKKAKKLYP
jgi:hypothetical protein